VYREAEQLQQVMKGLREEHLSSLEEEESFEGECQRTRSERAPP
jgi:hypothetical protein